LFGTQWETQLYVDLKNFTSDFITPDLAEILKIDKVKKEEEFGNEVLPMTYTLPISTKEVKKQEAENKMFPMPSSLPPTSFRKNRSPSLQFDEIKKHFNVPQTTVVKNMNVGLTILRKRCKELKITKRPYKLKCFLATFSTKGST